jgi:hypothetical protein
MTILGWILLGFSLLLWAASLLNLLTLNRSDPAGNALSQAFGMLMFIGLWLLLALAMLIAGIQGNLPVWAKFAALPLLAMSCAAALATVEVVRLHRSAATWATLSPAVTGLMLLGYCSVQLRPEWSPRLAPDALAAVVFGTVFLFALLPWPSLLIAKRERAASMAQSHSDTSANPARRQ